MQIADYVADDALGEWVEAFWKMSFGLPGDKQVVQHTLQLMLPQQDHMQHKLAHLHPQVQRVQYSDLPEVVSELPHPLLIAHACANCHRRPLPPSLAKYLAFCSHERLRFDLSDTAACRAMSAACPLLPELHNVCVHIDVGIKGAAKLARQLATIRRFASARHGRQAARLPTLASIQFTEKLPSARSVPVALRRALRLLGAVDVQHLRALSLADTGVGDVGVALLAPAIGQLTALTALDLGGTGIASPGAASLAGVLPLLPLLQMLGLRGIPLIFWPETKRAEGVRCRCCAFTA